MFFLTPNDVPKRASEPDSGPEPKEKAVLTMWDILLGYVLIGVFVVLLVCVTVKWA